MNNESNLNKFTCRICGKSYNIGDKLQIHSHLWEDHQLTYYQYYEYCKTSTISKCSTCGSHLIRMTPWNSNLVQLCSKCNDVPSRKTEVIISINEWFDYLTESHFGRLWLVDPMYRSWVINYDLKNYLDPFIKSLITKKVDKLNLFSIKIDEGVPKLFTNENKSFINIIDSDYSMDKSEMLISEDGSNHYEFKIGDSIFRIYLPEDDLTNSSHYNSYNIMNPESTSTLKKLKLSSDSIIKFYKKSDGYYSILYLEKDGQSIRSHELTDYEFRYIKMFILSNKSLMKLLRSVMIALVKGSSHVYDKVFFLNKFTYDDSPSAGPVLHLDWRSDSSNKLSGVKVSII